MKQHDEISWNPIFLSSLQSTLEIYQNSISSLMNLSGTYYPYKPNWSAFYRASEDILKINDVWRAVGQNLYSAMDGFKGHSFDISNKYDVAVPVEQNFSMLWKNL